jgi:protein TonB
MKNLSKLLPVFLLILFVGLACKNNPFAKQEPVINVQASPFPTETLDIYPTPTETDEVLNAKAVNLPKPAYPAAAKAVKAGGSVNVQVEVDEKGNVTTAKAVSGHPLLRAAAEQAAKQAKFKPSSEKLKGVIVYNFTAE